MSLLLLAILALARGELPCAFTAPAGSGGLAAARDFLAAAIFAKNGTLTSDLVICLAPGLHSVASEPHALTGAMHGVRSGGGRVVWRGGGLAAISGGLQVAGWEPTTLGGAPAFVAAVPAPLAATGAAVRALWVRGARAARTRVEGAALGACTPWSTAGAASAGFTCAAVPPAWAANSTASIEFTWPIVVKNWIAPRCTLASVVGANITLAAPCGAHLAARWGRLAAPVAVEAAPAFPLPPGVFFHDRDSARLFYAPTANQTAADLEADAWVAAQEVLSSLENVSGHAFQGVNFTYGAWAQANSGDGFVDTQAAVFACSSGAVTPFCEGGAAEPRGNVRVVGGAGVAFEGCGFSHLGAAYALSIMGGAKGPVVRGCVFTDLSGGFLKLGSITVAQNGGADPTAWDSGASVTYNWASGLAEEYGGACGYFGGFLFSADVSHNSVSDAGYSGFSQGWGWGTEFPLGVGNNTISYNRAVNVMRVLRDGGGIYVNGATNPAWPPSTMHHNFVDGDLAVYAVYVRPQAEPSRAGARARSQTPPFIATHTASVPGQWGVTLARV